MTDPKQVELMARHICRWRGHNPDQMVIAGVPYRYWTPMGEVIEASSLVPLWTMWELEANIALKFMEKQDDSQT